MARKGRQRRRAFIPAYESYYIPPFQDFCELLRVPTGPIELVNALSRLTGLEPKVGRSTVAKLTTVGVSEKSFGLLSNYFKAAAPGVDFSPGFVRKVLIYKGLRSNYASWCGPIEGVKQSLSQERCSRLYPMISFVEERARHQRGMRLKLVALRKLAKQGMEGQAVEGVRSLEAELYRKYTLVPSSVIDSAVSILSLSIPSSEFSVEKKEVLARYCLYQYWDFYLSALALFEALSKYSYQGEEGLLTTPTAFMRVLGKIVSSDCRSPRNVFEALLDDWRSHFSKGRRHMTWADLAKGIQLDPETTVAGTTLKERQKKQLRDWRLGKSYPSEEKLKQFLLHQPSGPTDLIDLMVFHGVIARALDRLINVSIQGQKISGVSKELSWAILREIFANYSRHYHKALEFAPYLEWKKAGS
ncbi:hypothetical protein [Marinobacter zhejiangensis]|uniref:Uncharacterized protein n=1 Tax=Marinobacter zhejiangensis TaxID=488535 RepID=A0A1I4TMA7_9GAMM|nr:hypothetical protein [Marinobacter zhejiangensis]SFM77670.1 hypothetical protein SAMN04487963_3658 [Marinobacter zhejiangensis]